VTNGEPTPRELLIELRAAVKQVEVLAARLDSLTDTLAKTYVPRGEYEEARKGDDRRMSETEKDVENQAAFRRQVAAGALVGLLLLVADIISRVQGFGS
jgi:hypothetical protein